MFRISYAAKVGLIFIVGIFLVFIALDVMGFKVLSRKTAKGYNINIVFKDTKGLQEGYEVLYNGIYYGEVDAMKRHQFGEVEVTVRILNKEYKIHRNAFFTITRESIFGSYILYISEARGGVLKSRGEEDKNTILVEMPRGETLLDAQVVYQDPRGEGSPRPQAGTLLGTVTDIVRSPDNNYSDIVTIKLIPDLEINLTQDHTFVAKSRIEERLIPTSVGYDSEEVIVGRIDVYERIKDNETVPGRREPGPEDLVASADALVKSASEAIGKVSEGLADVVSNVNNVLSALGDELTGDEEGTIKAELVDAIQKLQDSLSNVETITQNLNSQLLDAKPKIDQTLDKIERAAGNVESVTAEVNDLITDPELIQSIKDAIANLDLATQEALQAIREVESMVSDEGLQADIKGVVSGARETMEKASATIDEAQDAIDTISGIETRLEFRTKYFTETDEFSSDIDFTIKPGKGDVYYLFGIDDIGVDDEVNLQLGFLSGTDWAGRFGLKRGTMGVGLEYDDGQFLFRGDLYNPNDVHFDLYGGYALSDDFRFVIGFEDLYDEDLFHFGIATKF